MTTDAQVDELVERLKTALHHEKIDVEQLLRDAADRIKADRKRIEELEAALRRTREHLSAWVSDHSEESTAESHAVLHDLNRALEGTTNG